MDDREARERVSAVERLLAEIETLDEPARSLATDTVQALVELYGEGLARIVDAVAGSGDRDLADGLVRDELVSHLLLVHDLHPIDTETRVRQALDEVRPYLGSHGGDVELLDVEGGIARVRLGGSCDGCPSSAMTLRLAIEDAILRAAPELERIEADGVVESKPALLQIGSFRRPESAESSWTPVAGVSELSDDRLARDVAGERVLFFKIGESLCAYREGCPGCSEPLERAALAGVELSCAGCGRRYDVRRAGRCLDDPELHLEPVPLLVGDGGVVKVALAQVAA